MLILVNYGHNQTVGFRERRGQSLVKVGQTRSNLLDGPRPLDLVKMSMNYWVLELLLQNVNEEIILKDDENHVNIYLVKLIRQNDEQIYYFGSYIMYYHF